MITLDPSRSSTSLTQCGNVLCTKNSKTLLKCSRCHSQVYCGVECQKVHWPQHKKICVSKPIIKSISNTSLMVEKPMPISGLRLIENFISDELQDRFVSQMVYGVPLKDNGFYDRYMFDNIKSFDKVFDDLTKDVFMKLKKLDFFSEEQKPLKLACIIVGYKKNGYNTRHIPSATSSGGTIVTISFNSPVVLNFYSEKKTRQQHHKIFIPPRSMYSLSGEARYKWSHAILSEENTYQSEKFERGVRYEVLFTPPGTHYKGTELLDY